jgi:hypothetical protein
MKKSRDVIKVLGKAVDRAGVKVEQDKLRKELLRWKDIQNRIRYTQNQCISYRMEKIASLNEATAGQFTCDQEIDRLTRRVQAIAQENNISLVLRDQFKVVGTAPFKLSYLLSHPRTDTLLLQIGILTIPPLKPLGCFRGNIL